MVISAFIARADTELQKLADDIRKVEGTYTTAIQALRKRYTGLPAQAAARLRRGRTTTTPRPDDDQYQGSHG
jgi:hypothetical protein